MLYLEARLGIRNRIYVLTNLLFINYLFFNYLKLIIFLGSISKQEAKSYSKTGVIYYLNYLQQYLLIYNLAHVIVQW